MGYTLSDRNRDFVNFADAFLGHVSANFRSVHFAADSACSFDVRIVLRMESESDRMLIQEALEDFEAMRLPPYDVPFKVRCEVLVSDGVISRPDQSRWLGLVWLADPSDYAAK